MGASVTEQIKILCQDIVSEQDPDRFLRLVTKLNDLLQANERQPTPPYEPPMSDNSGRT